MRAIGTSGELRVSYQHAAWLGKWDAEIGGGMWSVNATVKSADSFWVTQTPLLLDLHVGKAHWIWDNVAVAVSKDSASITAVGKPRIEKESAA